MNRRNNDKKRDSFLWIALCLILLVLYFWGAEKQEKKMQTMVIENFPSLSEQQPINKLPLIYKIDADDKFPEHYCMFSEGIGWGGPFVLMERISNDQKILSLELLLDNETPSYMLRLKKNHFFDQFKSKPLASPFVAGSDVQAISGATVSSVSLTKVVEESSHDASLSIFDVECNTLYAPIRIGVKEIIIGIIFILALLFSFFGWTRLRYVTMFAGLIFIGFVYNFPFSISHFASIFLGYIPDFRVNFTWWFVVGGVWLLILITGKNLYCTWICPFGAIQEIISKISGFGLPVHPLMKRYGSKILDITVLSVLGVMFYTHSVSKGSYEPFSALFKLHGSGLIWLVLPLMLFGSFFFKRFYCRFFCPAGTVLTWIMKLRNKVFKKSHVHLTKDMKCKTKTCGKCKNIS
ncbi:4Fe-4S binding protein [Halosquirtibacter laminarini]|uniref:4Fe-4S binding protein n=1 Tax=Halosquirtibacter laminarini TaxID=3374600 RepID=A0AC61NJ66_9BACT|nr:4Fe-4S binding protein [Prolixibacteraceae bacterium]